jgi:hypothetical protein
MSDLAPTVPTTPAEPAAPQAPPAPAAPAQPAAATPQAAPPQERAPVSARDLLRGRAGLEQSPAPAPAPPAGTTTPPAEVAPAPKIDAQGNLHAPGDGKFVGKADTVAADPAAASVSPDAAPAGAQPDTKEAATPGANALPEGFVRIELPADHPLRGSGLSHLTAHAGEEDAIRNLINTPVRRAEVEQERTRARELERGLVEERARSAVLLELQAALLEDPRIVGTYHAMREEAGDEQADRWLRGLLAEHGDGLRTKIGAEMERLQEAEDTSVAQAFFNTTLQSAPGLYPHWTEAEVRQAIAGYGTYVQHTGGNLDPAGFKRFADGWYIQHPQVQAEIERHQQRQREVTTADATKAKADAEREVLERARAAREANPLAAVPATAHVTAPPAQVAPKSARELIRGPKWGTP